MLNMVCSEKYLHVNSLVHQLDVRTKLIILFGFICFCVLTPSNEFGVFGFYFVFLLFLAKLSRVPFRYLAVRSLGIFPFAVMVLLFRFCDSVPNNENEALLLTGALVRAYLTVLALVLLSSTTPFSKTLAALRQFGLPSIIIQSGDLMYRYLSVSSQELLRIERARDARAFEGRWLGQVRVIGQMIGAFFLRSVDRSQRIYWAMQSRGLDQEMQTRTDTKKPLGRLDCFFLAATFTFFLILNVLR